MTHKDLSAKGGLTRAANMTPAERSVAAAKAAKARWAKRVSCPQCLSRLENHSSTKISQMYGLGQQAKPEMGHAQFFCPTGRIALCLACKIA